MSTGAWSPPLCIACITGGSSSRSVGVTVVSSAFSGWLRLQRSREWACGTDRLRLARRSALLQWHAIPVEPHVHASVSMSPSGKLGPCDPSPSSLKASCLVGRFTLLQRKGHREPPEPSCAAVGLRWPEYVFTVSQPRTGSALGLLASSSFVARKPQRARVRFTPWGPDLQ